MRKRKIIISVVAAVCVLVGVFFVIRFGVLGRIDNAISRYFVQSQSDEEVEEELIYETLLDKDGNEYVVEMRKIIVLDEEGNEVEFWEDTADPKKIYDNYYKGKVEKIDDNKIYFMVDKENKSGGLSLKDVEDYEIVFDIDTYDLESDPHVGYFVCDYLKVDPKDPLESGKRFHSADELEFLVGEYLGVQDTMFEDFYTGHMYKCLIFYLR